MERVIKKLTLGLFVCVLSTGMRAADDRLDFLVQDHDYSLRQAAVLVKEGRYLAAQNFLIPLLADQKLCPEHRSGAYFLMGVSSLDNAMPCYEKGLFYLTKVSHVQPYFPGEYGQACARIGYIYYKGSATIPRSFESARLYFDASINDANLPKNLRDKANLYLKSLNTHLGNRSLQEASADNIYTSGVSLEELLIDCFGERGAAVAAIVTELRAKRANNFDIFDINESGVHKRQRTPSPVPENVQVESLAGSHESMEQRRPVVIENPSARKKMWCVACSKELVHFAEHEKTKAHRNNMKYAANRKQKK